MAYYWITEAQKYIQSLGFGTSRRPVNMQSQHVRINQWGVDNSFATTHKDELRFGKGGVDDAEDAEVILDEYGHAIHFSQGFVFGSEEAGAISEGFGDYWAVTVSDRRLRPTRDPACVADWDSVSYTSSVPHCLRRVDRNLFYPADLNGEVHHDGQSGRGRCGTSGRAVGSVKADTLILEAQFGFPGTTMRELAASTVAVAERLYGRAVARQVRYRVRGPRPAVINAARSARRLPRSFRAGPRAFRSRGARVARDRHRIFTAFAGVSAHLLRSVRSTGVRHCVYLHEVLNRSFLRAKVFVT